MIMPTISALIEFRLASLLVFIFPRHAANPILLMNRFELKKEKTKPSRSAHEERACKRGIIGREEIQSPLSAYVAFRRPL